MPLRLRVTGDNRRLLDRDQQLKEFAATGGTIGRSPDNDWVLPDDKRYVSSRHALIDYQGGAYYLVDTSRNGVYVNGADTPVGRGHPQRLFDGDRLRIGEYALAVEISADDEEAPDDGMRDSVVRAQLVPEEESVELMLVAEDRLLNDATLQRHLAPGTDMVRKVATGRSASQTRPPAASAAPAAPASTRTSPGSADQRAVDRFMAGAGLQPDLLAGSTPGELMQVAGKLLRLMATGLMELLRERSQVKDTFRIPNTLIQPAQNNPLKFAPSVDEALRYLLNDRAEGNYLGAEDAVRASFRDLREHEQAMVRAMLQAVEDYVDRFDPEELRGRFDKGLKRTGLLSSANKLKYWDLYEESYHALTQREEGGPPQLFSEEFARAYAAELEAARSSPRKARGR